MVPNAVLSSVVPVNVAGQEVDHPLRDLRVVVQVRVPGLVVDQDFLRALRGVEQALAVA